MGGSPPQGQRASTRLVRRVEDLARRVREGLAECPRCGAVAVDDSGCLSCGADLAQLRAWQWETF